MTAIKALRPIFELKVPPSAEFVAVARMLVVTAAKSRRRLSSESVDDLRLVVSEACTNAIEAQRKVDPSVPITVQAAESLGEFVVVVADHGRGFNPEALTEHPPVETPERLEFERGLGVPLITALTDHVEFDSGPEGTRVVMQLNCDPSPRPAPVADLDLSDLDDVRLLNEVGAGRSSPAVQ